MVYLVLTTPFHGWWVENMGSYLHSCEKTGGSVMLEYFRLLATMPRVNLGGVELGIVVEHVVRSVAGLVEQQLAHMD